MANKGQKLLMAAPTLVLAEAASAMAHGGGLGAIAAFGVAGLAYAYADEIKAAFQRGEDSPAGPAVPKESGRKLKNAGYRLLVGKSVRDESDGFDGDEDDDEFPAPGLGTSREKFTLSKLLESGFVPSLNRICIGRSLDGSLITVAAKDLCHVALPGATRHGKSSVIRLIMAQLCYVGADVLMLNPHYMRYDQEHNEDWTPYEQFLKRSPLDCAQMNAIKILLEWMSETLLKKRIAQCANGGKPGKPYFIVLDELPSIISEIKDASKWLGKLLRQGAKYNIFLIVASQDMSVKTLGLEGEGSVRKCFLTTVYVGGDPITATQLLNMPANKMAENQLGKGAVWIKCAATEEPVRAQVPYTDNEGLYSLLGPSTFDFDENEDNEDDEPETEHLAASEEAEPVQPAQAEPTLLQRAMKEYDNGATSVMKLAAALDITEWDARKLMAQVRREKGA